jgi:GNAT superfamily N-acetyltransferase
MLTIKRLTSCTFEEAVRLWNEGFADYFFPMSMTVDMYVRRMAGEGLSPEYSVVAYVNEQPTGFILNGIRHNKGKKIAWNGGTVVLPRFRGLGIARSMVQASLAIYQENGVEIATLEAISENNRAIQLYKSMGYKVADRLAMYRQDNESGECVHYNETPTSYRMTYGRPSDTAGLPFYKHFVSWQTQWQSLRDGGEALLVSDSSGQTVGYALYKRTADESGNLLGITLYQCEADKNREDREEIVVYTVNKLFSSCTLSCKQTAVNIASTNAPAARALERMGFTRNAEQAWMVRDL